MQIRKANDRIWSSFPRAASVRKTAGMPHTFSKSADNCARRKQQALHPAFGGFLQQATAGQFQTCQYPVQRDLNQSDSAPADKLSQDPQTDAETAQERPET